jgi:hypothetical protein
MKTITLLVSTTKTLKKSKDVDYKHVVIQNIPYYEYPLRMYLHPYCLYLPVLKCDGLQT